MKIFNITSLSIGLFFLLSSCNKEGGFLEDSSAQLTFSTQFVSFDTLFTTVTSSTRQLVVYNPYSQKIKINSIRMANAQSYFSLNVNGEPSNHVEEVEIEAKDSLYIFIKANINPNNQNNPVLITDSILFDINGKTQDVDIVACGQDAHFIIADRNINGLPYKIAAAEGQNITWQNDKPYVIYGYAVVDSTASLTINSGCKIYMHKNGGMWVYKGGSLKVRGTKSDPVVFQGDRREEWYANVAGQWDRIWINEGSVDNEINYAIIKNGFIGIQAETFDVAMGNKLVLTNTVIQNMSGAGILAKRYSIDASNNIVSNCGQYLVALTGGGNYRFVHNTLSNRWVGGSRSEPSLYVSNYMKIFDAIVVSNMEALFANTIIYGDLTDEIQLDKRNEADFNINFDHCLLRTAMANNLFPSCICNSDPQFKSVNGGDFRISANSPARDAGNAAYGMLHPLDIYEFSRDMAPDIGAVEYNAADAAQKSR